MAVHMKAVRRRTFEIISKAEEGDRVSQVFDWSIMTLIALSIVSIVLESFTALYLKYYSVFRMFEQNCFSITAYTIGKNGTHIAVCRLLF